MQEGAANRVGAAAVGSVDENDVVATSKAELHELQLSISGIVQGGCRELAKISDEAVAFLRGDLQASSFFYLHQISHKVSRLVISNAIPIDCLFREFC